MSLRWSIIFKPMFILAYEFIFKDFNYCFEIVAIASAPIPLFFPIKPNPSVVVDFIEIESFSRSISLSLKISVGEKK